MNDNDYVYVVYGKKVPTTVRSVDDIAIYGVFSTKYEADQVASDLMYGMEDYEFEPWCNEPRVQRVFLGRTTQTWKDTLQLFQTLNDLTHSREGANGSSQK